MEYVCLLKVVMMDIKKKSIQKSHVFTKRKNRLFVSKLWIGRIRKCGVEFKAGFEI